VGFNIDQVAKLARIRLKPEESAKLGQDLQSILKYVEKLNTLSVDEVEPTSHVLDQENVFRKDEVKPWAGRDRVLECAPDTEAKFFKVPKTVKR